MKSIQGLHLLEKGCFCFEGDYCKQFSEFLNKVAFAATFATPRSSSQSMKIFLVFDYWLFLPIFDKNSDVKKNSFIFRQTTTVDRSRSWPGFSNLFSTLVFSFSLAFSFPESFPFYYLIPANSSILHSECNKQRGERGTCV